MGLSTSILEEGGEGGGGLGNGGLGPYIMHACMHGILSLYLFIFFGVIAEVGSGD